MIKILDYPHKYYYFGELKKGVELFDKSFFDCKEVILNEYQVGEIEERLFLLEESSPLLSVTKGLSVNTPNGVGVVVEFADTVALVQTIGSEKVYYIKDLSSTGKELRTYLKALDSATEIKRGLDLEIEMEWVNFVKGFFNKNKPLEEEPTTFVKPMSEKGTGFNLNKEPVKAPTFKDKVAKTFKPVTDKINKIGQSKFGKTAAKVTETVLGSNAGKPKEPAPVKPVEHMGQVNPNTYSQLTPKAPPKESRLKTFLRTKNPIEKNIEQEQALKTHSLVHVSMNPKSKSEADKFNYHYKVGDAKGFKTTDRYKDHLGRDAEAPDFLRNGIYVPGEKVTVQGKDYTVKSHINPALHPETGVPDYSKMLIKDDEGKSFSVPREMVKISGPDHTSSAKVELEDGSKKYLHELQVGDRIKKEGRIHNVLTKHDKGFLAQSEDKENATFHPSSEYHKDFRHWEFDKRKPAEKGDIIQFRHNGRDVQRPVEKVDGEHAVVRVNKTDNPIKVHKDNYTYTGDKANEEYKPINDKGGNFEGKQEKGQNVSADKLDEFKQKLGGTGETGEQKSDFDTHISNMDKFVGAEKKPHLSEKVNENTHIHHLGIGDVKIKSTHDPDTGKITKEVLNPDVVIGGKVWEIKGVEPGKEGELEVKYRNAKDPSAPEKPATLDSLKKALSHHERENKAKNKESTVVSAPKKEDLQKELAEAFATHGVDKPEDINDNHNTSNPALAKDIHKILNKHTEKINASKKGNSLLEPERFKPETADYKTNGNDELVKHLGEDWHTDLKPKIDEAKVYLKDNAEFKKSEALRIEDNKKQLARQDEVNEQNKQIKNKEEKDYLNEDYAKLPSVKDTSESNKLGLKSADHEVHTKTGKKVKAEFHIFEGDQLVNSHTPDINHKSQSKSSAVVPFIKNPAFGPGQLRAYDDVDKGLSDRHKVLKGAREYNPNMVLTDGATYEVNMPTVDGRGKLMSGRGRDNMQNLLTPEQKQANKDTMIKKLRTFYPADNPANTDEKISQMADRIQQMDNPKMSRVLVHEDGSYYDQAKHNADYKMMTEQSDNNPVGELSAEAQIAQTKRQFTDKHREDLMAYPRKHESIDKYLKSAKDTKATLDYLKDNGIIPEDKYNLMWDQKKGLTAEGKTHLKNLYNGMYLRNEAAEKIPKLIGQGNVVASHVQDFTTGNINTLLEIQNDHGGSYDLEPEIHSIIANEHAKNGQEQGGMFEESNATKGLRYVMSLPKNEQEEILNNYKSTYSNNQQALEGNALFASAAAVPKDDKTIGEHTKDVFFSKYARLQDQKDGKYKFKKMTTKTGGNK